MNAGPRAKRVAVFLAATGLLVSACASSSGEDGAKGPTQPATESDIASFTFALASMPSSLNSMTSKVVTQQISSLVTERLERFSLSQDNKPVYAPGLAASVAEPDRQTLIYNLRPEAKFSDGTPLTASDVVWSINATAAPTAESAANMSGLESAAATGPNQVTVKWKYPNPSLRLALGSTVMIQQEKFATAHPKDLGTSAALPVGTGPYKFVGQTSQDITLEPNPHYWGTRPKPQKIKFTVIPQDRARQLAMRSNEIQGAEVTDLTTAAQYSAVPGVSTYETPNMSSDLLTMDTTKPPFNDIHVRKAVAYSIDRKGVAQAAYSGHATELKTLVPLAELSGVMPSKQEAEQFLDSLPRHDFDLKKAKEELALSAHPGGFSVEVPYVSSSNASKLLLLNLQENMKDMGVTITPKPVQPGQWFQDVFSGQATGINVLTGFSTSIPDPAGIMYAFVGKINDKKGYPNPAHFSTPAVEQALPAIQPQTSYQFAREQRWASAMAIATEVANQVPIVPLYSPNSMFALAPGLTFTQTPTSQDLMSGTWITFIRSTK